MLVDNIQPYFYNLKPSDMLVQLTKDSMNDLKKLQTLIEKSDDVALLTDVKELVTKFDKGEVSIDDIDKARELNEKFNGSAKFGEALLLLTPPPVCHF